MKSVAKFAKQYVVSHTTFTHPLIEQWDTLVIDENLKLLFDAKLTVSTAKNAANRIICLGDILNPYQPEHSNQEVVEYLVNTFEKLIYTLSGRWVVIIKISDEIRLYHDAAGLKPAFYSKDKTDNIVIASQPALLAELGFCQKNMTQYNEFGQLNHSNSWPIHVLPYNNVTQLIPNHYLDLENIKATRFWPQKKVDVVSVASTTEKLAENLKGTIKALTIRKSCTMSITGGYDSRTLLSCALNSVDNINFFTVVSDYSPSYDVDVPRLISSKYQLRHQFIYKATVNKSEQANIATLSSNVGGMYYDRSMKNIYAFASAIGENTHLPGSISEIARCYYYPYGPHLLNFTAKKLAKLSGFKNNPYAIKGLSIWLNNLPKNLPYYILDLLYWEQRLGVWASCGLTFREGVIDQIPPMNNREYMELSLSMPMQRRLPPHKLTRDIISLQDPSLVDIHFNGESGSTFFDKHLSIKQLKNFITRVIKKLPLKIFV